MSALNHLQQQPTADFRAYFHAHLSPQLDYGDVVARAKHIAVVLQGTRKFARKNPRKTAVDIEHPFGFALRLRQRRDIFLRQLTALRSRSAILSF